MVQVLIRCAIVVATYVSCASSAAHGQWQLYLEPFYGTAIIDQIESSGIGTDEMLEGVIDGRLREGRLDDGVAGLGVRLERQFGRWQTGANFNWRYRTDWDLTARTPSIQSITNIFSNVESRSITLFAGRIWQRGASRYAIDAGLGLVRNRIESEYLEREVPGIRGQRRFETKNTPRDLSWDVTLSWHRRLNENWLLGARYRFADLGDFKIGRLAERPARASARHRSHDLVLSIGRRF